jgi:8-oxo-dGTP pyrophosphatase MutT (NUDIX family)
MQWSSCESVVKLPEPLLALSRELLPVEHDVARDARGRRAAVLVLLYPRNHEITFALTVRPDTMSRHPGQISLPGGMAEPHDGSLWETAVRETQEELGLMPGRVMPLGRLDDVPVRVGESVITPFVGWNPVSPRFRPDRTEVAEVLEIPLEALLHPDAIEEETWELRGSEWLVSFYRLRDRVVWGITGLILSDLHCRLRVEQPVVRPGSVRPKS